VGWLTVRETTVIFQVSPDSHGYSGSLGLDTCRLGVSGQFLVERLLGFCKASPPMAPIRDDLDIVSNNAEVRGSICSHTRCAIHIVFERLCTDKGAQSYW
jgi:hypothetical protein